MANGRGQRAEFRVNGPAGHTCVASAASAASAHARAAAEAFIGGGDWKRRVRPQRPQRPGSVGCWLVLVLVLVLVLAAGGHWRPCVCLGHRLTKTLASCECLPLQYLESEKLLQNSSPLLLLSSLSPPLHANPPPPPPSSSCHPDDIRSSLDLSSSRSHAPAFPPSSLLPCPSIFFLRHPILPSTPPHPTPPNANPSAQHPQTRYDIASLFLHFHRLLRSPNFCILVLLHPGSPF